MDAPQNDDTVMGTQNIYQQIQDKKDWQPVGPAQQKPQQDVTMQKKITVDGEEFFLYRVTKSQENISMQDFKKPVEGGAKIENQNIPGAQEDKPAEVIESASQLPEVPKPIGRTTTDQSANAQTFGCQPSLGRGELMELKQQCAAQEAQKEQNPEDQK